ncbi:MAG TPA: diguanylate cyclase [Xanthomonadales bacterium]|nr:diguanylate cyclase [Xanthomonadales bacterium]
MSSKGLRRATGTRGARARGMGERQLAVVNRIARIATEDLELTPMLKRVVDAMREGFGWEFVSYLSLDLRRRRIVCEAVSTVLDTDVGVGTVVELGQGVTGQVAQTGRAVLVRDARNDPDYVPAVPCVRSELCVPVRHRGELLGVIDVESIALDAFSDQQELVATIADQVAGAIAAARLHQELARRAALLEMMSEISHNALQADQLADVLARIARFLHQRFDVLHCAILLEGRSRSELVLRAAAGETVRELAYGEHWPASRGIVGRAWRLAQPQWVPDLRADPDHDPGHPGAAAELVVPIRYRDRLLGVIDVQAAGADALPLEVRNMVRALADQVAGAIHLALVNQRLLDTIQLFEDKSEQLEHANEQLRVANGKLERLSSLDGLTGIANRRQFDTSLRAEWRRARRRGHVVSLLLIDIDRFKAYNDGYGHLAGDECLKRVAQVLAQHVRRAEDLVARFGGEEFAVLLPETTPQHAMLVADELRMGVLRMKIPHKFAEHGQVSISVGLASAVPQGSLQPAQLIDMADKALYAAKLGGRNAVRRFQAPPGAGASAAGGTARAVAVPEGDASAEDDVLPPAVELRLDRR